MQTWKALFKLIKGKMKNNVQRRIKTDKESIEKKKPTSFLFIKFPKFFLKTIYMETYISTNSGNLSVQTKFLHLLRWKH